MIARDRSEQLVRDSFDANDANACSLLTQAITTNPLNAQAHHERAMRLLNLNREREALADFDRALELDPKFPGARDWRARTLFGFGEYQAAAEDRLQDLRDNPGGPHGAQLGVCPQNWAECAEAFAMAGNTSKAIELLEEYLAHHAARVSVYACYETAPLRLLARLYDEQGEAKRAASLRERARASPHRVPADF